jgi:hypothetical protein
MERCVMDSEEVTVDEYFDMVRREVECRVKWSGRWLEHAWEDLYVYLSEEGLAFSECGPRSAVYYAVLAEATVEFLTVYPNQDRLRLLQRRLTYDLDVARQTMVGMSRLVTGKVRFTGWYSPRSFLSLFENHAFTTAETELMRRSVERCILVQDIIAPFCPDTS